MVKTIKYAMDMASPKTNKKHVYQLKSTPEIRELEERFRIIIISIWNKIWLDENFREYINIRQELKEKCKENYNKKWDEEIKTIVDSSRNSRTFWNKINKLKGRNMIYTDYLKDSEGNKY